MSQSQVVEVESSNNQPMVSGIIPLLIAILTTKSEDLDSN